MNLYGTWLPHSGRMVASRKCQWPGIPHICKDIPLLQFKNRQHMQSGCYVRNITEGKDFKGVVWCVGEVLRT